ncbi:hypothetical protein V8E55_006037 [Tylopilus felleus]
MGCPIRRKAPPRRGRRTTREVRVVAFSTRNWVQNDQEKAMSAALAKVAKEVCAKQITAVAIAFVMQKTPYVFPIIGGRNVEHLEANLEALETVLTPEHIKNLESIVPFDPGFPTTIIGDSSDHMLLMRNTMERLNLPFDQSR